MAAQPKLTVGLATHRDYSGVYFTLGALKLYHADVLPQVEVLVIDQSPDNPDMPALADEVKKLAAGYGQLGTAGGRYVPYTDRMGTSASRDRIFAEARGEYVAVLDCHVLLAPGCLSALLGHFAANPDSLDIVSGPILTDGVMHGGRWLPMATHYADHWRDRMWGVWASAWACPCGGRFAPYPEGGLCRYETVGMQPQPIKACPDCGKKLPMLEWPGHETHLLSYGYTNLGASDAPAFPIPGQGLGFFACRKAAWPGFNPNTWGFGGEELYIHEKFRRQGGQALCLPACRWLHRFPRPDAQPSYVNTDWYKCRNYVLEFLEMGWPLDPVRQHFVVDTKVVPQAEWDAMVADPLARVHGPDASYQQPTMVRGQPQQTRKQTTASIYAALCQIKRDLDQHLPLLRELASGCNSVLEFSKRRESLAAWLAAEPAPTIVRAHNLEQDGMVQTLKALAAAEGKTALELDNLPSTALADCPDVDLLYIDTVHHADRLRGELAKFGPHALHYIVARGTGSFGVQAEGGGPGLFDALREWVEENPDWFVMYHTNNQYGITVLSRVAADKPPQPLLPWPPGWGPGSELMALMASLGIKEKPNCDCRAKAVQMDRWGIDGCEAHYDEIVGWLREGAQRWGWLEKLSAAAKAVTSGLAWQLNPADPYPGVVRAAIDAARAKAAAKGAAHAH